MVWRADPSDSATSLSLSKGTEASGYFLDNLGFGPLYRTASALLCFHMMVAFLILGNVLSR